MIEPILIIILVFLLPLLFDNFLGNNNLFLISDLHISIKALLISLTFIIEAILVKNAFNFINFEKVHYIVDFIHIALHLDHILNIVKVVILLFREYVILDREFSIYNQFFIHWCFLYFSIISNHCLLGFASGNWGIFVLVETLYYLL